MFNYTDDKTPEEDAYTKSKEYAEVMKALKDSGIAIGFGENKPVHSFSPESPKIVQWVVEYSRGFIKDENQASYVLIGCVVVMFLISLYLIMGVNDTQEIFTPGAEAPVDQVIPPSARF